MPDEGNLCRSNLDERANLAHMSLRRLKNKTKSGKKKQTGVLFRDTAYWTLTSWSSGYGEVAQLLKHLPCKHGCLSLVPRTPTEILV